MKTSLIAATLVLVMTAMLVGSAGVLSHLMFQPAPTGAQTDVFSASSPSGWTVFKVELSTVPTLEGSPRISAESENFEKQARDLRHATANDNDETIHGWFPGAPGNLTFAH